MLIVFVFRWTVVILGALAFHAVLGSCLLQPVKRHLIDVPIDYELQPVKVCLLIEVAFGMITECLILNMNLT